MIAFIIGKVYSFGLDYVIIENNGIGYRVNYMHPETLAIGQTVTIYTYQHVREDEISLFGFVDMKEYDLFMQLIDVKGIGPKTALNILSVKKPEDLINIIESNDLASLKKLPGVGAKSASQIILDLKGRLIQESQTPAIKDSNLLDAIEGLKSLGYKQSEINAINSELSKQSCKTTEDYIKVALQLLMKRKGV